MFLGNQRAIARKYVCFKPATKLYAKPVVIALLIYSNSMGGFINTAFATSTNRSVDTTFRSAENSKNHINIDLRLFMQDNELVIQLPNHKRAIFSPSHSTFSTRLFTDQTHYHKTLGRISSKSKKRIWQFNPSTSVEFLGSYPIKITTSSNSQFSLTYRQHQIESITTKRGLLTRNQSEYESAIAEINDFLQRAATLACPHTVTDDTDCDDESIAPPTGFDEPTDDNIIRIDIRPGDCFSYFTTYSSVERGTAIEAALAQHPPYLGSESGGHSFPIADFWNNGQVFVVISRDLTAAAYDPIENPSGLYDQLLEDGESIQQNLIDPLANQGTISHTEHGETTTLTAEDAQVIYLDVVIQYGVASPAQQAMLEQAAADLLDQYGIVLRIIEIP